MHTEVLTILVSTIITLTLAFFDDKASVMIIHALPTSSVLIFAAMMKGSNSQNQSRQT